MRFRFAGFPLEGAQFGLGGDALATFFDGFFGRAVEVLFYVCEFAESGRSGAFASGELVFQGGNLLFFGVGSCGGEAGAEVGDFDFHCFDGGGFGGKFGGEVCILGNRYGRRGAVAVVAGGLGLQLG